MDAAVTGSCEPMNAGVLGEFFRKHVLSPLTVVIVSATGLLVYLFWFGYHEAVRAAEVHLANLTWMIESRVSGSVDGIRTTLDELAARLTAERLRPEAVATNEQAINAELDLERSHLAEVAALRVFDAAGDLLYTSSAANTQLANIADRPFFRQLRDDPGTNLVYSEVIIARTNGARTTVVARALRGADGRFLGMIGAQLNLAHFRDLFAHIDVGPKGLIAIRRSDDFKLVLRQPELVDEINKPLPSDHPIRRAIAGGARETILTLPAYTDGVTRVFSVRAVDGSPFYVLAAMAEDDVLAAWRVRTLGVGLIGLLGLAVIWGTRGRLLRRENELVEVRGVARQAEDRLRLLVNVYEHIGEAIVVTGADNRIVSVNRAFTRLTGYPLGEVEGRNPKLLSAGRTTPEEYTAMWRTINERGRWQGEVWDRRKDGSCYPKWLTISTLRDGRGEVTHYIGSFTDISERKAAEQNIHHLAHHDSLTGLPNRFSLQQRLEQAIAGARRDGRQLAVMFVDLDHFKTINDTLGHPVGDGLLIEVARRLLQGVRESDIIARLGGDEFVVVITDVTEDGIQEISAVADKIVRTLSTPYRVDGLALHSTPSIGISVFPTDGNDVNTLMKSADTAMYHAKSQGRRNFQFFTAAMNEVAATRLELENSLRLAVEREEFVLHFQPQLEAASGRVVGVEALVRWQHPVLGLLSPDRFVPLAEENGLIEPLGHWVLDAACRQIDELMRLGFGDLRVAVNISARQLRQADFVGWVTALLSIRGVPADKLELEITESLAAETPEAMIAVFRDLRALGVVLSIDDFGTGHSSLSRLKMLPIHQIKLDRSFVRDIEADSNDATICAATIALAHSLGLAVVAEGVETETQLTYLRNLRADLIQGYYFSKPLPAAELIKFLKLCQASAAG